MEKSNLPILKIIEPHLVDYCNIKCKACTHFSTVAPQKIANTHQLISDIRELSTKFRIYVLRFLGGEPLLHPEISNILIETRKILPYTELRLCTNGIYLPLMKDDFWNACKENHYFIDMTKYPCTNNKFTKYLDLIDSKGVRYGITYIRNNFVTTHNKNGDSEIQSAFAFCKPSRAPSLRESRIYVCPKACYIDYYNNYFNLNIPKDKGINIYNSTAQEILEHINTPVETCKWCNSKMKIFKWELSSIKKEDWDS